LAFDDKDKGSKPLTREQYRKLKLQQQEDFEARDKRRVQVEREYAKRHQQAAPEPQIEPQPTSRTRDAGEVTADFKTPRWRKINRRLNVTIAILISLMVVVFLVLFFVN
jgi:hypothetical protein